MSAIAEISENTRFMPDGDGYKARIGLIYMASSIVMDAEMAAMAAEGVSIHTTRIKLPKVTVEGIEAMMNAPELEQAARLLASAPIDVLCFGGTSASFLHGTAYDHGLIAKMKLWAPDVKITTASTATLAALKAVNAGPVALATPYVDEVHARAIRFLEENGHQVVSHKNLRIDTDQALAEVPLEEVYRLVREVDHDDATAIFISCTNFRSVGAIEALETALGKPVISAIQASFWHSSGLVTKEGSKPGYGSLMSKPVITV
ncbi:maleate cis-trans isomerase family protein [Paenochrobactrum pullorum]|uniref:maleate cis-trans isomerase family protein n=1 Tax=Paenochrobactrum pullorum TaxID=1324351 RepID=UPI0035BC372C